MASFRGVRIPPAPECVPTRSEIEDKIKSFGGIPLYSRRMVDVVDSVSAPGDSAQFVVKQFNLLAEGLSSPPDAVPPFQTDIDGVPAARGEYGGFDRVDRSDIVFNFDVYRRWRLLEEIIGGDSQPDILTVQECDHFPDFFLPCLAAFGYDGVFEPKIYSPSCRFGYFSDGVAIFWKTSLFRSVPMSDRRRPRPRVKVPRVVQYLEHIPTRKNIIVATCHLKAKTSNDFEMLRVEQISTVLSEIHELNAERVSQGDATVPVILMGDFNTMPSEHSTSPEMLLATVDYVMRWHDGALMSAYPFTVNGDKTISTWKWRGDHEAKRLIDYIWISRDSFDVISLLSAPNSDELALSRSKLPDLRYPSDHLAIAARLRIK